MSTRQFHVVAFDGDDSVAVIPDCWMNGGECWWLPYKGLQRLQKAVEKEEVPGNDWTSYGCRVLYSGSFIEAEKRLGRAEETSDLQSEVENIPAKRGKISHRRLAESDDSSFEDEPMVKLLPCSLMPLSASSPSPTTPMSPPALPTPFVPALPSPPTQLVKYLADLGSPDVQDTVSRIMETMMDNNLAGLRNFKGLKGKRKLQGLNTTSIIFRCLRIKPVTRQANLKDTEAAITKWLGGARDRHGGRKSRGTLRMPAFPTPSPAGT